MAKRRMGVMAALLCLCACFMVQAASAANAKEPISPDRECALTIFYRRAGKPLSGRTVEVYQIAEVSADGQYTPLPAFAASGLDLNAMQTGGEQGVLRSTLEAYILANDAAPTQTAVTDGSGRVCFSQLKPGLYLVSAVYVVEGGVICSFDCVLLDVPAMGADNRWQYQLTVTPKPEVLPFVGPDHEVEYKVLKLWKGDAGSADRPDSIEVELFRDGVLDRTVTLSQSNHWVYTWSAKEMQGNWAVAERTVPTGYTATAEKRGTTFVLTNTLELNVPAEPEPPAEDPPVDNPPAGDTPTEQPPVQEPPTEEPPERPGPADSPVTGDTPHILLYTVLMFVSGAVLLILGMTGKRTRNEETN